VSFFTCNSMR